MAVCVHNNGVHIRRTMQLSAALALALVMPLALILALAAHAFPGVRDLAVCPASSAGIAPPRHAPPRPYNIIRSEKHPRPRTRVQWQTKIVLL